MKRFLAGILALLMIGMFCGCGDANETPHTLSQEEIDTAGFLVLANKTRLWPEDSLPADLINLYENRPEGLIGLRNSSMTANRTAFAALCRMLASAKEAGHTGYTLLAAYRDYAEQQRLYEENTPNLLRRLLGQENPAVPAGASEHHTGLAFDLGVMHGDVLEDAFSDTEEGQWVLAHCAEYGFILRYPGDKSAITGVIQEGWHFRYVGDAAVEITEKGWCLEEYPAAKG